MTNIRESNASFPAIGILGGGQLAQMLAQAAWPLGLNVRVLVQKIPDALPGLAGAATAGDWNHPATAASFAHTVDVVTLENEFVNPLALAAIEAAGMPLFPSASSLGLIQDKWRQKETLLQAGIPVTSCRAVSGIDEVKVFAREHGWPVVLKRRHLGYDGKGNATAQNETELEAAWNRLAVNEDGLFVEAFCSFERELAVMVVRSIRGQTAVYPVVDTIQKNHICHLVRAPSDLPAEWTARAMDIAVKSVETIGNVGATGVEMFLRPNGDVLVNELAPRVHNSGHYTIEGCHCSQFENHLRAILGWPLGDTAMQHPAAVMINLLGQNEGPARPHGLDEALSVPGAHLHLYGKSASARGRKMGHITAVGQTIAEAESIARAAAAPIVFGPSP